MSDDAHPSPDASHCYAIVPPCQLLLPYEVFPLADTPRPPRRPMRAYNITVVSFFEFDTSPAAPLMPLKRESPFERIRCYLHDA